MTLKFVAIIPNYWGKADSPQEALKIAMRESGSRKKVPHILYITNDPKCWVDDFGSFCYHTTEGLWVTKIYSDGIQVEVHPDTVTEMVGGPDA
jgi:hypothetical protein